MKDPLTDFSTRTGSSPLPVYNRNRPSIKPRFSYLIAGMIERYTRPEMQAIWTEERKLSIWLQIELLNLEALVQEGVVPEEDYRIIRERARFDINRCREIEKVVHHDVIAFTTCVTEFINHPASRWFHYGLTSSDILDTALAVQMKEAADLLIKDTETLLQVIAHRAREHMTTPCIGRSHGVHAEPITFGFKLAVMYDEFSRALRRLKNARQIAAVGKISGAVGTNAHLSPKVERYVCEKLGLTPAPISTQIVQRDIHAEYMQALALVASSLEKWAVEFRHLQRTEVLEAEEPFSKGQKGSSAMPHKRNPIRFERISGLARVIRANAMAALENIALWHERDISHSSVERIILPDSTVLLDYMLVLMTRLMEGLQVYPENMKRNLNLSLGLWNSQAILLALVRKGLTREKAYELVQRNAMKTWEAKQKGQDNVLFLDIIKQDPEVTNYLPPEEAGHDLFAGPPLQEYPVPIRATRLEITA